MRPSVFLAMAVALLVGVTVVQGRWTERWAKRQDHVLEEAGRELERAFPESFGDWKLDRSLETSKAELERAGAVGSISRIYRNAKTKALVSAFVVCATPHDASGHTPDRCYPGAGFEIAEAEHRQTIDLPDGRAAEAFTGTFAKKGQTLRIFWSYGVVDGHKKGAADRTTQAPETLSWLAPQIARIALSDYPAVYKIYVIIDQTKMSSHRASGECSDFIAKLVPEFEKALASTRLETPATAAPAQEPPAEGNAAG